VARDVTRRGLIQGALLILGIVPAGVTGCAARRVADRALPSVRAAPDAASELSSAELEALIAFGEALVEGRTLSLAERRPLVEHIADRVTHRPGVLPLYRTTVSTLDRLAGRRFASLEVGERIQLIARHHLVRAPGSRGEEFGPLPAEILSIQLRVVPYLIRSYYGSPAGWAVVGYQTFPGRCGDLTRYTRAES
jgi:hypothetical protein